MKGTRHDFLGFFLWMTSAVIFAYNFNLFEIEQLRGNFDWVFLGILVGTSSAFLQNPIKKGLAKLLPPKSHVNRFKETQ